MAYYLYLNKPEKLDIDKQWRKIQPSLSLESAVFFLELTIKEFWRVLVNGEDHVQDIPPDRFNVDAFYDPNPDSPRKTYVRKAGLVKSFDEWDNKFFGISDKEAELVDPQQHFVLEAVHMALEDGGITRERLNGSETGVYIGTNFVIVIHCYKYW
ncbi:phenolphthiocerol/phthiocerol polyketide synthase subunit C-like [Saccostrea cucullata]|uniref:phenolphthiocerol/phthiocerol polyketide synthase subunit C-like n=1 Tax=Saccostrea cuccullata TaxID=36930 RepID=UPI002ED1C788